MFPMATGQAAASSQGVLSALSTGAEAFTTRGLGTQVVAWGAAGCGRGAKQKEKPRSRKEDTLVVLLFFCMLSADVCKVYVSSASRLCNPSRCLLAELTSGQHRGAGHPF